MESETMKIELGGKQQKKLIGFFDELRAMAKIGKPGICVARVWAGEMKVKVLSHEQALAVEKLFESFVTPRRYILYDARAWNGEGTDAALVLVSCDNNKEAKSYKGEYGGMACYSYQVNGKKLEDERWEWDYSD